MSGQIPAMHPDWTRPLAADTRACLAGLEVLETVDSTNAHALRQGPPAQGVQAWLAEHQHAGRGRQGRIWQSPPGSQVVLSLSRAVPAALPRLAGLSLATGVAAVRALRALGFESVGLKWPNDLMAGGRKLGGILVELEPLRPGVQHVVLGIGLNVSLPRDAAIDQPWCDLAELAGGEVGREAVAIGLLDALVPMLARFETTGLATLLEDWPRFDLLAGRPVRLSAGGQVLEGTALGIDSSGALRLGMPDGRVQLCHAGEASVRAA